jgi:ATP-dependent Clp protease ATP-binding subunit ClpC
MFERYTEKARRVIFFARYEASQFGSPYIETEHLLLGLLREDKPLTSRFISSHASLESIQEKIDEHTIIREKIATSVDLPLSNEGKRVLAYAAEEADQLKHTQIGTEHLLLGMLREEKCFAAQILEERGVKFAQIREELARVPHENVETSTLGKMLDDPAGRLILAGVTIQRPKTCVIDPEVEVAAGTVIEPYVQLLGRTRIGSNCRIRSFSVIEN